MTSFEDIQVKITPREKIFQQRQTSLRSTDRLIDLPRCFYHPDDEISYFCKNPSCTLPLCQKCLNIHRTEHLNKKEIPMQNVITFKECKEFVLTQLKSRQSKVKNNHQEFQAKLKKYKESLFESIQSTLIKLRDELYAIDKQTSVLLMNQISQALERVSQESSLTDIIRCYEHYYQKKGQNYQQSNIGKVKFVLDEKQLAKVVEKGFLNCQFVRQKVKVQTQRTKINCQEYLKYESDSPQSLNTMKSPINQLNQMYDISMQDFKNNVIWQQNVPINEFPISQIQTVIEVKRQQRRSIFKQKEQKGKEIKPQETKTILFDDIPSKQPKKQPLFSAVKQYKIENGSQDLQLGKKKIPMETPKVSRNPSNSSMKSRGKGISLVKTQPLREIDHIRQIQRQPVNNTKLRLKSQTNLREQKQVSFGRQSLGDWKRVVNLTDSNASSSRQSKLSNQRQNYHAIKNEGNLTKTDLQGFQRFKGLDDADILNPTEMKQLIMKKKNINHKAVENTYYLM